MDLVHLLILLGLGSLLACHIGLCIRVTRLRMRIIALELSEIEHHRIFTYGIPGPSVRNSKKSQEKT